MTELILTKHARDKMDVLNLSLVDVYGFFVNGEKCQVGETAYYRKQTLHNHKHGSLYYRYNNYILVVSPQGDSVFSLVTVFKVESEKNLRMYK